MKASQLQGAQNGIKESRAMGMWMRDVVPFGIFTTDREFKINSWNDWLSTHSGLSLAQVWGKRITDIYPEIASPRLDERYNRVLAGEISVLSVALHKYLLPFPSTVPESGLPHMLQTVRIAPLPGPDDTTGTITIIEDVTQREFQAKALSRQLSLDRMLSEALAKLLQSEDPANEMAAIFASVRIALGLDLFVSYLVAPDGESLQLNAAMGVSPKQREAIATLPLSTAGCLPISRAPDVPGHDIASPTESLRQLGINGLTTFPLAVGERVLGLVAFGTYEKATANIADSSVLARIAGYVGIALDRAKREQATVAASRAKDDFLATLSHELRTPLNPVLLIASDARVNPAYPAEAREAFAVIEKNALLEARLIDDLLDLNRIAHGKLALDMQRLDIVVVLRDAISTVQSDTAEHGLTVFLDLPNGAYPVRGDSGRLCQVFWNILNNAVKFTPRGGQITIASALDAAANEVIIRITDTGIGMEAGELAKIFGNFVQGNHAVRGRSHRFGGLGLGLALSRKLVEMHSGRIEAASAGKGQGSTFTIYLPLLTAEAVSPIAGRSQHAGATTTESRPPIAVVRRILLVEDHEQTRNTLSHLLKRRGYEVVAVASAQAALNAASAGRFALVLSDIGLPDSDGFELMRNLRAAHGLQGVALTGYGMEEDLVQSRDAGFLAHLTKPININILDAVLDKVFQN